MQKYHSNRSYFILFVIILGFNTLKSNVDAAVGSLTDVSSPVGLLNVDGVVAGFCDFDSDRDTDILVISTSGNTLVCTLYLSSRKL